MAHDQIEAMTMADNIFAAGFIGSPSMNFLHGKTGTRDGRPVVLTDAGLALPL